ncbi:hypothetical protein [Shewanella surugensis]|uniref:Hemerythrin-like domain-containing protein n=1 Tax=Shewanella surugensis TaxID=212020 RepID=A0ABT0LF00_9GAMM|nr:hypothetical protein [Shewanella surugensis]MCL1125905.1 hypothetical protein [Shewanella surugensis]
MDELFDEILGELDNYIAHGRGDPLLFIDELQKRLSLHMTREDIVFPLAELRRSIGQLQATNNMKYHRLSLERLYELKTNCEKQINFH